MMELHLRRLDAKVCHHYYVLRTQIRRGYRLRVMSFESGLEDWENEPELRGLHLPGNFEA